MGGRGYIINSGGALAVAIPEAEWSFWIRRTDLQPHAGFLPLHGKPVGPTELAALLPNWRVLPWRPIPDHLLASSESHARDGEFEVYVSAKPGSGLGHDEVVGEFLRFMARS